MHIARSSWGSQDGALVWTHKRWAHPAPLDLCMSVLCCVCAFGRSFRLRLGFRSRLVWQRRRTHPWTSHSQSRGERQVRCPLGQVRGLASEQVGEATYGTGEAIRCTRPSEACSSARSCRMQDRRKGGRERANKAQRQRETKSLHAQQC
ncbi:hypothetical protein BS50DRAFT_313370 [Corynespora cassiicola Philippines]|uniref:Uncharacterized protein n=1 Tax=Corynespora cassiicola Philippines TaxID=1448308 RepID=A0A2T2NYF7_CORCC|nr:hypothetical protein BS50DRAFT_313370 [Corynespora cassiicola Philippines]